MWPLWRIPTGAVPQVQPVADFARLEVRLCDLEGGVDLERMRADDISLAVVVPEWFGVVAFELEMDCVCPR